MNDKIEYPINPHLWRKFAQAQTNMLNLVGMNRRSADRRHGSHWNGKRTDRKHYRRVRYWSREMLRLSTKLFGA